jgi:Kelch motif
MASTAESPIPTGSMSLAAAVCQAPGSQSGQWVYAIGGTNGSNVLASVAGYDTVQKKWFARPSMPTARSGVGAATSPGRIHVLGGFSDSAGALTTHEVYEPANDAWSTAAPLPSARGILTAVTGPDGLIYAIGGFDGKNPLATVDAYDPATDKWTSKASMHSPRTWHAAAVGHDGLIYAIGGGIPSVLSSMETFNVKTNTWKTSSFSLPVATCGLAAAVDPSGLICAIGGDTGPDGAATPNVYCYNPADAGWIIQPPMSSGHAALAAATGPEGLIYTIGGTDGTDSLTTVAAFTTDKCYPIEQKIAVVQSNLSIAQSNLGDLPPQDRVGAEKQIIGLGTELRGLETQLRRAAAGRAGQPSFSVARSRHRWVTKYSATTTPHDNRLSHNCVRAELSNAICTSTATIPAAVRIDSTGKNHIFTRSFSGGVLPRNTICDNAINR